MNDIPADWKAHIVKKNTTVNIRPSNGVERFKVSWSDSELISDPDLDVIVISNEGREYPCKLDIFKQTYEFVRFDNNGQPAFGKTASYTIVEIPKEYVLEVVTLEGPVQDVKYPDYLAIGPRGEVYVNTKEFVDNNLTFVD